MKAAYFDCFSGISGDMTLGALVDAGCPLALLRAKLQSLQVPGWQISSEKVWKNGMAAMRWVPCWPTYPTLSTLPPAS